MLPSPYFELLLCPYCAQAQESYRAASQLKVLLMVGSTLLLFLLLATGVLFLALSFALKDKKTIPTLKDTGGSKEG